MLGLKVSAAMLGPSNTIGMPDKLIFIIAGAFIQGIFAAFPIMMCVPEIIERLTVKLEAKEGIDDQVINSINDKANDVNVLLESTGQLVGLLLGTGIYQATGDPHKPGEIVALANLVVLVFFVVFNCGLRVFSENKEFNIKLKKLKKSSDQVSTHESKWTTSFARGKYLRSLVSVKEKVLFDFQHSLFIDEAQSSRKTSDHSK